MSTRANIIIKEGNEKLYFYRHSDGYPEGAMPLLTKFMGWMKSGKIRNDIGQGGGWLIVLGSIEYNNIPKYKTETISRWGINKVQTVNESVEDPTDWKVGSIEPTTWIHGDIEFLYVIDMDKVEIRCYDTWDIKTCEGIHEVSLIDSTICAF